MSEPRLIWDCGTAYDLFLSLSVLHHPKEVGLRGAWAAGARSRVPPGERELLQKVHTVFKLPHQQWIYRLPDPKDGATVLRTLEALPPEERLPTLFFSPLMPPPMLALLEQVLEQNAWTKADLEMLQGLRKTNKEMGNDEALRQLLEWCAQPESFGEGYLAALRSYYEVFFAEEEERIGPVLKQALKRAQAQAQALPVVELLEALSQGVRYDRPAEVAELVLAPVFWTTPLVLETSLDSQRRLFLFGVRPAEMSLVPGEVVPDLLHQVLKALADPTRLRILRYLSEQPLTPAELAARLRLRAPTVVHHLHTLRLARLVYLTLEEGVERRYALRRGALLDSLESVRQFLGVDSGE